MLRFPVERGETALSMTSQTFFATNFTNDTNEKLVRAIREMRG
jgi:hypothetical protein